MLTCKVGDDFYHGDPTVQELESLAASILGKEAAIFVPSGTMSNQLAAFVLAPRGTTIIAGEDTHVVNHEYNGVSIIAGAHVKEVRSHKGELDISEIESKITKEYFGITTPLTSVLWHETLHSNGRAISIQNIIDVSSLAKKHNLKFHIDGSRIFNAASYLKCDPKEISKHADTVNICLSKGLCSPVGSLLVGSEQIIEEARRKRKVLGGGLRQVGVLAAPGIISLTEMTKHIAKDHQIALLLANKLNEVKGLKVDLEDIHGNIFYY